MPVMLLTRVVVLGGGGAVPGAVDSAIGANGEPIDSSVDVRGGGGGCHSPSAQISDCSERSIPSLGGGINGIALMGVGAGFVLKPTPVGGSLCSGSPGPTPIGGSLCRSGSALTFGTVGRV